MSFSRSQGQTAGRRWVWRVIPLHLSINLETISSIPYRMSMHRWAEDESIIFFLRLSLEFPSKHINTSRAIIFYCPSLPFWQWRAAAVSKCSWVHCVPSSMQKRSSVWKLQDVTGSFLCHWHHSVWAVMGHVPEISCLIGSETLKEMTLPQLPSLSLCQRESLALPLLLHLLISVCRWSNLYLSVCAALLYSVTWRNWNWMPAKLQQTANGAWDTPWFSHWPDSLICKKLVLMNISASCYCWCGMFSLLQARGCTGCFYCFFWGTWASPRAICPCMNAKAICVR